MRVIVTGSRRWADAHVIYRELTNIYEQHGMFELIHGACSTGADAHAHEWFEAGGRSLGCIETRHPADWEHRDREAGPEGNRRMIQAGADIVLAFPLPEGSGTQHTVRLARAAGIEVREFHQ
ncbi:DUF2493 domain-containing protein [Streptomyces sp. NPDC050400]|uniref:DUF2493 domain-containing protein n=1 Tax=Streptomyces sp. NPDC050400 TaxID=3365610 RepID=UPI0037B08811